MFTCVCGRPFSQEELWDYSTKSRLINSLFTRDNAHSSYIQSNILSHIQPNIRPHIRPTLPPDSPDVHPPPSRGCATCCTVARCSPCSQCPLTPPAPSRSTPSCVGSPSPRTSTSPSSSPQRWSPRCTRRASYGCGLVQFVDLVCCGLL